MKNRTQIKRSLNSDKSLLTNLDSKTALDLFHFWVESFRENTVIGGEWGIRVLKYDAGSWSLDPFVFLQAAGGELAQPYWAYEQSITLQPSGLGGSIQLTASAPFWTSDYVGQRVRYGGKEVSITSIVSSTVANGTVVSRLPPTWSITVASGTNYIVGEVVIGADTNFQGLVTGVAGNVVTVITIELYDGPDVGERLVGGRASSTVSSKASATPAPSPIWDEAPSPASWFLTSRPVRPSRSGPTPSSRFPMIPIPPPPTARSGSPRFSPSITSVFW